MDSRNSILNGEGAETRALPHASASNSWRGQAAILGLAALVLPVLYWASRENYLLFHGVAELLGVAVAWGVFLLVWNSRQFVKHDAFAFLGLSLFFAGGLDLLHMLAYQGMGVLAAAHDANPATQLWIAARILASSGLLFFPALIGRRIPLLCVAAGYGAATLLAVASILVWEVFPACFVVGAGLTPFKRVAEYVLCLALALGLALLRRRRDHFEPVVYRGLAGVFLASIASEFCFTLYSDVYGVLNYAGHILKLGAVYLLYRSLIQASLTLPYLTLFRELDRDHRELRKAEAELRQSETLFRSLFDLHAAVKLLIDPETGAIVDANQAAVKYYGWSRDEMCRMRIQEINMLSPDEVAREMQMAVDTHRNYFEFRHRLADGSIRDVAVFSSDVTRPGRPLLHSIIHDITEQKAADAVAREMLEEKTALLKEIHHRVKNNLQIVASLLGMQARRLDNAAARDSLQDSQARVFSMALLHELLYRTESLAKVDFGAYTERLGAALLRTVGPVAQRVRIERRVEAVRLSLDQAVPCGLIINELVANALKHGYPDSRGGRVLVELQPEDGMLRLRVSDDGVGLPAELDLGQTPTLGLRLVQDLARQLRGQFRAERCADPPGGTEITIVFPWKTADGKRGPA